MPNKPRWTTAALDDFEGIVRGIKREDLRAAIRVAARIEGGIDVIVDMPFAGRQGAETGTRDLILGGLPYIIVYRVEQAEPGFDIPPLIVILRIRHGAMQWPPDAS